MYFLDLRGIRKTSTTKQKQQQQEAILEEIALHIFGDRDQLNVMSRRSLESSTSELSSWELGSRRRRLFFRGPLNLEKIIGP